MSFDDLVVIVHWDFGEVDEEKLLSVDPNLANTINQEKKKLISDGIEIFDRNKNLIVTENGWRGAVFGEDVKRTFEKDDNVEFHYPRYKNM